MIDRYNKEMHTDTYLIKRPCRFSKGLNCIGNLILIVFICFLASAITYPLLGIGIIRIVVPWLNIIAIVILFLLAMIFKAASHKTQEGTLTFVPNARIIIQFKGERLEISTNEIYYVGVIKKKAEEIVFGFDNAMCKIKAKDSQGSTFYLLTSEREQIKKAHKVFTSLSYKSIDAQEIYKRLYPKVEQNRKYKLEHAKLMDALKHSDYN